MTDDARPVTPIDPTTRFAVEAVVKRFGLAIDLRDRDVFGACLDDRVLMDLDPRVAETPDAKLPREAIVENARGEFEKYDATLHLYSIAAVDMDAEFTVETTVHRGSGL